MCLLKNGTQTVTANIPFGGFRLTGIGAPTATGDALREGSAVGGTTPAAINGTTGAFSQHITMTAASVTDAKTTVASGTTPDIWTATGRLINYTGTATATGFAAAPQAGASRELLCADAAVFTAGANLLIQSVSSGSNFTAAAGDVIKIIAVTTTQFRMVVDKSSGNPTASAAVAYGRHSIPIVAASMQPSAVAGCAALARTTSAANQPDIVTLDFDTTTQEYAQFGIPMPKSWNEGTITFSPIWSHAATTVSFGVVWDLQAVAVSNDDTIAAAFGTAQTSTDTGGTTNDLYVGPESSAITIAGTPAAEDTVFFRLSRVTGNGGDTMTIDARLHGIVLYITTDAANDA